MKLSNRRSLSRRAFINRAGAASALVFIHDLLPNRLWTPIPKAVRVSGRVECGGNGLHGVRVSDGYDVVLTDADGTFSIVTNSTRPFVWISVPDGYEIPVTRVGTARFFFPIPGDKQEIETTFELSRIEESDAHAFLLLADPQTQNSMEMGRLHAETVPDILETVSGLSSEDVFGVSCGDIMYDNLSLYPQYEEAVKKTDIPFFQVVGNHDLDPSLTDTASVATFNEHFGPRYYSFDRGEVHYVVLDDVLWHGRGYIGCLDGDQLVWLENDLQTVEDGRTVVVFAHIPLVSTQFKRRGETTAGARTSVANRDEIYRLLEPFRAHVLSAHMHEQEHVFEGGIHEHVHGAVCGAWWSGDICSDGTPNGYGVYEVRGSDVRWRYKATGKPDDYQIRSYTAGADPVAPNEVVANVWGWDPEWSVYWYEDGERRGMMSQRIRTDPLSERLHRGPDLPTHRPWVDPVLSSHLFYCPAPKPDSAITIEAVDRWGNTFVSEAQKD